MTNYKEVLKYRSLSFSQRQIADFLSTSRNTIAKVYASADACELDWIKASKLTEEEISIMLFPKTSRESIQVAPDCEYIHKELQRKGVTLSLLWKEYVSECHSTGRISLQYAQYCNHYRSYRNRSKATMHFEHFPGERIEVDWAGTTIPIYGRDEEVKKAYLFVGTLPYSQYSYAEVTENMKQENWINAHVNMFHFFGGVTPIIYPDNLKTGVITHPKKEDVILNKDYEEMGNYYMTAIVPTLPRSPKGKPSVEGTVGKVTTQIIAKLRNKRFTSVFEAHKAAIEALNDFNSTDFQKREGSRKSVFESEERKTLISLPKEPYEYAVWKKCTVQFNYHVAIAKNYYSVPYEYIRCKVDARITKKTIEIYYKNQRVCSHSRINGGNNRYSTKLEHMPTKHQEALEWNGDRLRNWAKKIGSNTFDVVDRLLKSYKAEQQGYTGCRSLLKLSDKYSNDELENACKQALIYLAIPRYKNIKLILQASQDQEKKEDERGKQNDTNGAYIRGATYFGGNKDE